MDNLRAQQSALADDLLVVQRQLDELRASAESPDGLITATVDGRGRLTALALDARIYRTTDTEALADQILAAVEQAGGNSSAAAERIVGRILGHDPASRRPPGNPDLRPPGDPGFDLPRRLLIGSR